MLQIQNTKDIPKMNEAVLKIDNLSKNYGAFCAVNNVSFAIQAGEVFGLLGPNGAGKTTIISTIVTTEEATKGQITIQNKNILSHPIQTKSITGFVPQEVIAHGYFNVEEILHFQSGYYGITHNEVRIHNLLKRLELWEHRHKSIRKLSGGMKRRLMIAKALVHSPALLLLDEPTAGVDVELRHSIWEYVKELKKQGTAILFTTHYLEEAEALCDRIAILHKGKIRKQGETKKLIQNLTCRHITISLNTQIACSHPYLIHKKDNTYEFRVPYSTEIGAFLSELSWQNEKIKDLQIREGTLEDAFKYVLNTDS